MRAPLIPKTLLIFEPVSHASHSLQHIGMVSKLYGSMHYDFLYYMVLSLLGFFPRTYVYTSIGGELFNPFSARFIIYVMLAVVFTGFGALVMNLIYGKKSKQMTQTLLIYSQKEKYKIVF